ncbi:MAG: hypothetical protein LUI87_15680 [Lachnospiraceae bacterium]|nr:hypothetical protein [Lachnospiraceae bacterium]
MKTANGDFEYSVLAMNYERCNFSRMRDEWIKNQQIMWELPGNTLVHEDKKGNCVMPDPKNRKTLSKFKVGTVIYFYVTHLPTCNQNRAKSRILMRGVVCEAPQPMKFEEIYFRRPDPKKNEKPMIFGFAINDLSTLSASALKNDWTYSGSLLERDNPNLKYVRGNSFPNSMNKPLSDDLICHLEQSFCHDVDRQGFEQLIEHFNQECFFKECKEFGTPKSHETFVKRCDGLDYCDIHHFIPHAIMEKKGNKEFYIKGEVVKKIIENPLNKILLCPKCHKRIHLGLVDDVNRMIDEIWKKEEIRNMLMNEKEFLSVINAENEQDVLKWIKKAYINI